VDYPVLIKLYYKNNKQYIIERENRKNSIAATVLPINIHKNAAFYMNCMQLTGMIADVYHSLMILNGLVYKMPAVALDSYIRNCLIDEVMMTNDIEGVYSTRKEISDILDAAATPSEKKLRLEGLVRKYQMLCSDDAFALDISDCAHIRALYDEIVAPEIPETDLPDGRLFRKDSVSVVSVTDKVKHKGMAPPEENIIGAVGDALKILEDEENPVLINIALFHYLFGYIHPFYDGNGRLSRFISSYLIKKELGLLVALRLSYTIKNNRKAYYDAFETVNNEKNYGDVTPFLLMFLEILRESVSGTVDKLEQGMVQLEYYHKIITTIGDNYSKTQINMIYILVQNKLFGDDNIDIAELSQALDLNEGTTRKTFDEMLQTPLQAAVFKRRQGHKYCYYVDLDTLEQTVKQMRSEQNG
jgi:Fic family protein